MKVRCVKPFTDLLAGVERRVGDVWDASQARLDAINATSYGQLAVSAEPPMPEQDDEEEEEEGE